ncbi:MAG: hypothetical protein VST69_06440 [Nitrospirota bacterium]|nr:hypothetical protein [Nitrospirota bacterium]
MRLHFEKLSGTVYPAYLVVADYSIALEPELIESLKKIEAEDNEPFLKGIVQKVGINRYLREMIEEEIDKTENQADLVLKLRNGLKNL